MGQKAFSRAGRLREAVSPEAAVRGLSRHGDTARDQTLRPLAEAEVDMQADVQEEPKEEGQEDREEEDMERAKVRRAPRGPTATEREEHEATHMPYRNWCRHCVRGRGSNHPHKKTHSEDPEQNQKKVPKIAMDYFFMAQQGERAAEFPMIVMLDEATGNRYMRAVGKKGLGEGTEMEWLIKDMSEELKSWGYSGGAETELIFKSDGESSITAVRDRLGRYHGGKITPEQPPPGESPSNGRVEEAGKTIRGYVRVFKDMIEDKIKGKLGTDSIILQWLIRWAAMLHSRVSRGDDGRTAYERQRGRKCNMEIVPFGESVHYRRLDKPEDRNKLESNWEDGIWLGHARGRNETLVGTRDGVVRAWAVKRKPAEERWNDAQIREMQGTPARPNPSMPGTDIPVHIHIPVEAVPGEPPPQRQEQEQTRRTYLKKEDFETHGYSEGCEGCRRLRTGGMTAKGHTEECRNRMEELLKQDDNPRWRRAKHRMDERVYRESKNFAQEDGIDVEAESNKFAQEDGIDAEADTAQAQAGNMGDDRSHHQAGSSTGPADNPGKEEEQQQKGEDEETSKREREGEAPRTRQEEKRQRASTQRGKREREDVANDYKKKQKQEETQGQKRPAEAGHPEEEDSRTKRRPDPDPANTENIQTLMSVDLVEIGCPAKIATEAKKFGLIMGEVMDITTGWDFSRKDHQIKAEEYVAKQRPKLILGRPRCTTSSVLQRFTPWNRTKMERYEKEKQHLEFATKLYEQQAEAGRQFVHEQPSGATSWSVPTIQKLQNKEGVYTTITDQCMFGKTTTGGRAGPAAAARKRVRIITNSHHIARELEKQCNGVHKHQPVRGRKAKRDSAYMPGMCRAICRGLAHEKCDEKMSLRAMVEVAPSVGPRKALDPEEFHEAVWESIGQLAQWEGGGAWDDVTGMPLDRKQVQAARAEEIEYVRGKKVWTKIPRAEAVKQGIKIVKTRWIDINKGDDLKPVYRSRFVAKEFNDGEAQGLFAGTPPLEALRYLLHDAATGTPGRKVIMLNDVARAFFEARARRKVCIEIPEEDRTNADRGKDLVGLLNMSLYGTRDAARNWQEEVARMMREWGFRQGMYSPCLYIHPQWGIRTLVHGDDFVSTGDRGPMARFRAALEARFKIKTQVLGAEADEMDEARVLNRIVRITENGWEYEPDQRHIDLILEGLGLTSAKPVTAPGEEEKKWEEKENAQELGAEEARRFRGLAARLNYLALDRPDIAYSTKEACRYMARPTLGAWKMLKRLGRYLAGNRRTVLMYAWQGEEEEVEAYSDSDWAGCRVTGKSTSGGSVLIGEHYIKGWSSTQNSIALSSGEAELVALTRATAETIGILNMIRDLGQEKKGIVYADSTAALAIADRKGSGKLRHMLWIQEKERREEVTFRKVKGEFNPADLLTKYMPGPRMGDLMRKLSQQPRFGKAETALEVQGSGAQKRG